MLPNRETMDLEQTLEKIVELAREELHIVRKRSRRENSPLAITEGTTTKRKRQPIG